MKNILDLRNIKAVSEAGEIQREKAFNRSASLIMVAMLILLALGLVLI